MLACLEVLTCLLKIVHDLVWCLPLKCKYCRKLKLTLNFSKSPYVTNLLFIEV